MNKGEQKIRMTEFFCALAVLGLGEFNGTAFEIVPQLPVIFSNNIDIDGIAYDVDLLRVETSDRGLVCWFADKEKDTFFVTLHSLLSSNPLLYTSIVTYIFDLINNLAEDC